jgi:hypothetical protein
MYDFGATHYSQEAFANRKECNESWHDDEADRVVFHRKGYKEVGENSESFPAEEVVQRALESKEEGVAVSRRRRRCRKCWRN